MKTILIAIIILIALSSCQKDYSLEYFKQYNADAPNRMMAKSKGFKSVDSVLYKKFTRDLFLISLYYQSNQGPDSSFGQFNHKGRMLTFVNGQ